MQCFRRVNTSNLILATKEAIFIFESCRSNLIVVQRHPPKEIIGRGTTRKGMEGFYLFVTHTNFYCGELCVSCWGTTTSIEVFALELLYCHHEVISYTIDALLCWKKCEG